MKMAPAVQVRATKWRSNDLIRSLKNRSKWPWMKEGLKSWGKKPGNGWSDLSALLDSDGGDLRQLVEDYYSQIILAGNKYVQIFDLPLDVLQQILPSLRAASVAPSIFSASYPYCLEDSELRKAPSELTLCEAQQQGDDFLLVYCSRRDYVERHIFEGDTAREIGKIVPTLEGFSSIVGVKTEHFQAFDVVAIRPRLRRVEIMVDLPIVHSQGLNKFEQANRIMAAISSQLSPLREILVPQAHINLFPAIKAMYQSKDGGMLQEIGLRTSTGLVDYLRTTVDGDDLRQNSYHAASAEAVNKEIDPFEITSIINLSMPQGKTTIRLASTVRELGSPEGSRWLHGLELIACESQKDAVRAINKVISFVG